MVMAVIPMREWERTAGLYSSLRARLVVPMPAAPRTVTMRMEVPVFWVMVARNFAPVLLSSLIQPVAEGRLIAPAETVTVVAPILGVELRAAPRTLAVLVIRLTGLVP